MNFKQALLNEVLNNFVKTPFPGVRLEVKGQLDSLATYLLNPTVTPKALGLTYATIKYWEAKGYLILPLAKDADEWRKYSVIELLWFQLLKKVVDMGCVLDKIAPQLMFAYANYKAPNCTLAFNDPVPPVQVIDGVRVTPFDNFLKHVLLIIISRSRAAILFNSHGCQVYFEKGLDRATAANQSFDAVFTTGINVCISDVLFKYVLGVDDVTQKGFQIFSKEEMEVIGLLNKGEIKGITIKQNDGKIYQVEALEKLDVKDLDRPLTSFITGDYQELDFRTNNNKKVSLQRTTKKIY